MATRFASTWQLPTFCTYISHQAPYLFTFHLFCFPSILTHFFLSLQAPLRRFHRHLMNVTVGSRRQHCRGGPHEVRGNQVPMCLQIRYLRIPLGVPPLVL